jgi:hypothetical protein
LYLLLHFNRDLCISTDGNCANPIRHHFLRC